MVYILFGLNVVNISSTIEVTVDLDTSKYWQIIMQTNERYVHKEYILYTLMHAAILIHQEWVLKNQLVDILLIDHFYLIQMDISASNLVNVEDSRTYKPVMVVIWDEGGNQAVQTIVRDPDNIHAIITSKTRYRKYYFLDYDQAQSISLNETLSHESMRITYQKDIYYVTTIMTKPGTNVTHERHLFEMFIEMAME